VGWAWWWDIHVCFVGLGSTGKSPPAMLFTTIYRSSYTTSNGQGGRSKSIISSSCSWLIFYYPPFFSEMSSHYHVACDHKHRLLHLGVSKANSLRICYSRMGNLGSNSPCRTIDG
jgi:hypothetical protein